MPKAYAFPQPATSHTRKRAGFCAINLKKKESTMDTTPPPATPPGTAAPPPSGAAPISGIPPAASTTEDKTVAILSYLTLLGFIAAIIIHSNKKTQLGAYHLRQALGIFLTWIGVAVCQFVLLFIPVLGWLAVLALWISMIVMLVMGFISAIQGQMKPVPVMGPLYQKWFGNAFN